MPDFERLTDKLALDLAKTPEERARINAYQRGKYRARKEVAIIAAITCAVCVLFTLKGWCV